MDASYSKHKIEDYIGKKYGHVTVIGLAEKTHRCSNSFVFQCDCGNTFVDLPSRVISGHRTNCGQCEYRQTKSSPKFNIDDYIGKKKHMLTVIGLAERKSIKGHWKLLCQCDCGGTIEVLPSQFKRGVIQSCGCLRCRPGSEIDGKAKHPLYEIWNQMMGRCYLPNSRHYDRYGGRGIKVCDEWHDFWKFVEWSDSVGGRPKGYEIDRIDNDGNYCPENCRWASRKQQMNNTSHNVYITFNGQTKTLKEWSEYLEVSYSALNHRHQRGWSVKRMLTEPVKTKN